MNLSHEEQALAKESKEYVKQNWRGIVSTYIGGFQPVERPVSIFMAGSPGAGKTEFSNRLIEDLGGNIVHIDADTVRDKLPHYHGGNAAIVQGAAALGVEKLYDVVLQEKLHAVLDGTFRKYEKAKNNIQRSIDHARTVDIFYIFQDPLVAWDFTKKREELEGRNIPKDIFAESFFAARENVGYAKRDFGENIRLHIVLKNIANGNERIWYNVDEASIDLCVSIGYTPAELLRQL